MGLASGQKAWTVAAAGLLRSDASRSGYSPIGRTVPLYALSGVARSNATRSNYHGPRSFITIDDVPWGFTRTTALDPGILIDSLQVTDQLNEQPNTCQFTAWGFQPREGQRVLITLGSVNGARLFHGRVLNTEQYYQGKPAHLYTSVSAIDDTWALDARKVSERYQSDSYEAIVRHLIATYADPSYTVAVEPGLGSIDEITFTNQDLPSALTQLAKRGGYAWLVDEWAVVRFFLTDTWGTPPSVVNAVHPSLDAFRMTRDLSQLITRVLVEGGGVIAGWSIDPGETILPLDGDAGWYPAGGVVVSGPQRIHYAAVSPGYGGGLVGLGAAPTGIPGVALADGPAGVDSGTHDYAVTFVTASGESIAGPTARITTGDAPPPATAPTAEATAAGSGPNIGTHDYAVTFVTASGETTPGPIVAAATGLTPAPPVAPNPGTPTAGAGVTAGTHDYAITFVTPVGETTAGPISYGVTTGAPMAPPPAPGWNTSYAGAIAPGTYSWATTWKVAGGGETLPSPVFTKTLDVYTYIYISLLGNPPPGVTIWSLYRTTAGPGPQLRFVTSSGIGSTVLTDNLPDASLGGPAPTVATALLNVVPLTSIAIGGAGPVTARKLYRRSGGAPGLKLVATIADNTTTTYTDTTPTASLGAAPPVTSTAYLQRITLSAIQLGYGQTRVTGRRIYRTVAGGSALYLVTTIADNVTTTWLDTVPDTGLGPPVPTANTATANRVTLTAIPVGAAAVTARKLYRTLADGAALYQLATLGDNTATTYTDAIPDASLGVAAPPVDTSGLVQGPGNVLPGATALPTANTSAFPIAGWAVVGNGQQVIRYTGKSGGLLTGIPAAGTGAIIATIAFNASVSATPQLSGIPASGPGMIRYPILKGDPVNILLHVEGPIPATVPIVAIGDSLTAGWLAAPPYTPYTDVLDAHLAAPWTVINKGIPGDHTTGMWGRFQTDVLDHQPAYVIIMGGTNDTRSGPETVADIQANLAAMYAAAEAAGAIVVACTIWPGRRNTSWTPAIQDKMEAVNQWIRAVPPHVHYVVDGYVSMAEPIDTQALRYIWDSGDGVHANPAGYAAFGEQVYAAIPWDLGTATPASRTLRANLGAPADGIIEGYLQDRRLSAVEARARGEAQLALRGDVEVGLTYTTRDVNTRSGRQVEVNLPSQHVVGSFLLREVVIARFGIPNLLPTFTATASTERFSFETLLRTARKDGT